MKRFYLKLVTPWRLSAEVVAPIGTCIAYENGGCEVTQPTEATSQLAPAQQEAIAQNRELYRTYSDRSKEKSRQGRKTIDRQYGPRLSNAERAVKTAKERLKRELGKAKAAQAAGKDVDKRTTLEFRSGGRVIHKHTSKSVREEVKAVTEVLEKAEANRDAIKKERSTAIKKASRKARDRVRRIKAVFEKHGAVLRRSEELNAKRMTFNYERAMKGH